MGTRIQDRSVEHGWLGLKRLWLRRSCHVPRIRDASLVESEGSLLAEVKVGAAGNGIK
ncbi:MAG: hypothetical protein ACPHF4_16040 [Rubripirellula sp.]